MSGSGRTGFTLIELLIVVAIIAILAAIAVPNFLEAQVRAKVTRAKADMRSLRTALEAYRVDYEQYPPDVDSQAYPWASPAPAGEMQSYKMLTTPVAYMTTIPVDPFYGTEGISPSSWGGRQKVPYFEYSEENVYDATDPIRAAAAHGSGAGFLVISVGPDRYRSFGYSAANWLAAGRGDGSVLGSASHAIGYDPTNGTVSQGDVISTRKGFVGG